MFRNTRTGQSAAELKAYPAENEHTGKIRLQAGGWVFPTEFVFDDSTFKVGSAETKSDGDETDDAGE